MWGLVGSRVLFMIYSPAQGKSMLGFAGSFWSVPPTNSITLPLNSFFSMSLLKRHNFGGKQHLSVQSSHAQAKRVFVCVCVCWYVCLSTCTNLGYLSEATAPRDIMCFRFPTSCPHGSQRCEWIPVFISLNMWALSECRIWKDATRNNGDRRW